MSDFAVSISELKANSSDIEKVRVWNLLRTQALHRFETSATGTTDGAGTWLTLWSGTVPTGATVGMKATATGRGTSIGALFEVFAGFQNFAGTVTYIGGTFTVTLNLSDAVAIDIRWALSGTTISLQVRDDATQAMAWKAFISGLVVV